MPSLKSLSTEQFDRALPALRDAGGSLSRATPTSGWIKALRTLLGMSSSSLARKLGIAHSGLLKLEKGELSGSISLRTLRRVANAMEADLLLMRHFKRERLPWGGGSLGNTDRNRPNYIAALQDADRNHYAPLLALACAVLE